MIEKILSYLRNTARNKGEQTDAIQQDAKTLNMALLMIDIAGSDHQLDPLELQMIREILAQEFSLKEEEVDTLINHARNALEDQTDLWDPISHLNAQLDRSEKLELLFQLWRIIYADGRLDGHEDHLIHKIADLLKLDHEELIRAKLQAKDQSLEQKLL